MNALMLDGSAHLANANSNIWRDLRGIAMVCGAPFDFPARSKQVDGRLLGIRGGRWEGWMVRLVPWEGGREVLGARGCDQTSPRAPPPPPGLSLPGRHCNGFSPAARPHPAGPMDGMSTWTGPKICFEAKTN